MSVTYEEILAMKEDQKINLPFMRKDLKILPGILSRDEKLITFITNNEKQQGVLFLTNHRLIYISKKLTAATYFLGKDVGSSEVLLPLDKINSTTIKNNIIYSELLIRDSSTAYEFRKLGRIEAERFKKFVDNEINKPVDSKVLTIENESNLSVELRSLKSLLDDKMISKEEYDKKRSELL